MRGVCIINRKCSKVDDKIYPGRRWVFGENDKSNWVKISNGIPQGIILGRILVILIKCSTRCVVDTNICRTVNDLGDKILLQITNDFGDGILLQIVNELEDRILLQIVTDIGDRILLQIVTDLGDRILLQIVTDIGDRILLQVVNK